MNPIHDDKLPNLNRIEGQIKGIRKMIEDRRYCVDILTQLKAVRAALNKVEQEVLKTHMHHCLTHAVESGNDTDIRKK